MEYTENRILKELETKLSAKSNWMKTLFYGVYSRINVVVAYVVYRLVYLANYLFGESVWGQATNIESLMARTEYYSYNPHRKIGASGYLWLSEDPTWSESYLYTGENIVIPQWTLFSDADKEIFVYATEETILYTNQEGYIEIPVKEGVPKEFYYTALGEESEQIELTFESIDDTEVYVYLLDANGAIDETFTRCEQDIEDKLFFVIDEDNYYCSIKNSPDFSAVIITFGDGVKTKKLSVGDKLLIKYAETNGDEGDITNADTINTIYDTLYDISGNPTTLYVRNDEAISGGDDIEDIDDIRYNAPNLFNTGYRCGGYDDWKTILESDSRVYKAIIWSTDDVEDDTITANQNKIYVTGISTTGEDLSTAVKNDITINLLKPIKSPTEVVSWQSLKKVYAKFTVDATITNIPEAKAQAGINTALEESYGILYTDFKESIFESNFIALIDNLSFIINHVSEIEHLEKFEEMPGLANYVIAVSVTSTDNDDKTEQVYLTQSSLEVYVRLTDGQGGYDDPVRVAYSSGTNIIGDNGYTVSGDVINYSINTISFTITDLVVLSDYELAIVYKTEDGNGDRTNDIRLMSFDLITDTDEDYNEFTFSYE
jgi:hypothetical protein